MNEELKIGPRGFEIDRDACDRVRHQFQLEGRTFVDWAVEQGFNLSSVYAVLNGRSRALRGEAHRIAIALGLKPATKATNPSTPPRRGG